MHYDPLLYSLVHAGNDGDLDFYVARTAGAGRVLELGVGYGRVLGRLAREGRSITGIDRDPGLLALARREVARLPRTARRRTRLVEGDMTALSQALPGKPCFDCVIIPYSGLWCLLDDAAVRACLNGVRALLLPGGRLLLDAYAGDGFHAECTPRDHSDAQLDQVAVIVADGRGYDVHERSLWDREKQRLLATYVYTATDGGDQRSFDIHQRYLLRAQLEALLAASGFARPDIWGDFEGLPYTLDSELIVVQAVAL